MKKIAALTLATVLLPTLALAQGSGITDVRSVPRTNLTFQGALGLFNTIIDYLFTILLVLAVVFIIIAAFRYLTAAGDEEKVGKAHKTLLYAVVAIAVALLAQGIVFIVEELILG